MSEKVCEVPALMGKWAISENGEIGLEPDKLTSHSDKKAWWRCVEKSHLYQRYIYSELLGRQCPICRKEQMIRVSERPDLMMKWGFAENEALGLSPENLSIKSSIKAWWKCIAKGHLYQRPIFNEALFDRQCPECRKETKTMICDRLDLMGKWACEENQKQGLFPEKTTVYSAKKAWWRCLEKSHLYQSTIYTESLGRQCPICRKEQITRVSGRPDLMMKWGGEENEALGLSPENLSIKSSIKAWWKCTAKGHLYQRPIFNEAILDRLCPVCQKETKTMICDRLDLIGKWAFMENQKLGLFPEKTMFGSAKKAWWRCTAEKHLYQRAIYKESIRNPQCPICKEKARKHLSDYPELLKEFAYDLNDVSPEDITNGNDNPVFWRCKEHGHIWKAQTYHRIKDHSGCPYCMNKSTLLGYNDLATVNPPNLKYWDYEKNDEASIVMSDYVPGSHASAWWLCDKGHSIFDSIFKICGRQAACSECLKLEKQIRVKITIDKKVQKEEGTRQWKEDSAKREQEKLHIEKKRLETKMTTEKLTERIAPYWDFEANRERGFTIDAVTMNRLYCFMCANGHRWKSDLLGLLVNSGCPVCRAEENSIAQKYPYLVDVYDTKKNGGVPPSQVPAIASNYYWWTCNNGHSYVATLRNVAIHKETGCMFCDRRKSVYSL